MNATLKAMAVVLALLASESVALGSITVKLFNGYGNGPGGEFDVRIMPGDSMTYQFSGSVPLKTRTATTPREFATFCLERSEFISFNTSFVATVDSAAMVGGFGNGAGVPAGVADPLSPQTAWVYTQFANKTLSNYNFGNADGQANSARETDADDLQMLIWWLENEVNPAGPAYSYDNYDPLNQALAQQNLSPKAYQWYLQAINAGWTDLGNVRVMNLWNPSTGESMQSQLMMIPAPGAVGLALLGIATAAWIRRRKQA